MKNQSCSVKLITSLRYACHSHASSNKTVSGNSSGRIISKMSLLDFSFHSSRLSFVWNRTLSFFMYPWPCFFQKHCTFVFFSLIMTLKVFFCLPLVLVGGVHSIPLSPFSAQQCCNFYWKQWGVLHFFTLCSPSPLILLVWYLGWWLQAAGDLRNLYRVLLLWLWWGNRPHEVNLACPPAGLTCLSGMSHSICHAHKWLVKCKAYIQIWKHSHTGLGRA